MDYLDGISGTGTLKCHGQEIVRDSYDLDGFATMGLGAIGWGEIHESAVALQEIFGGKGIPPVADEGRRLVLQFSEKSSPRPAMSLMGRSPGSHRPAGGVSRHRP